MRRYSVTKDEDNFSHDGDYNVVAEETGQERREFVARKLSYAQAIQLRQECENADRINTILTEGKIA
jgi:hypothetical protein